MIYPVPKPKPKAKRVRVSLKHGKPLKRTKMRNGAGSKRRKGHMFPKNVDEPYRDWIRALSCILSRRIANDPVGARHQCETIIQACHVKTRGSGGKDRNNLFPACASAHAEQHITGIRSFERRWGVYLKTIARQLTEVYEAEKFPCP